MKINTLLLSSILAATPWLGSAQSSKKADLKDVTNNLDMDGQFFMANNIEGDLGKIANLMDDYAKTSQQNGKSCFPEGMDFRALLKDFGLDQVYAYGRSAKFAGDHWVSKMYVQNSGSTKGIFSIMGKESTDYVVHHYAPSGSDLVLEMNIDTRQLVSSLKSLPECEWMDNYMNRKMPAGGTTEDLLNQFKAKMSVAVWLDENERVECPIYPEYTFPRMHSCFRMEGAGLIWKQVGNMAGFMFKMEKLDDGTMLMTPKRKRKGREMIMVMDTENDLLWAASSLEFLAECRGDGAKLVADADYKTISGGSTKGNMLAYISRQACLEIRQVKEVKLKKEGKKCLSDGMMKKVMDHLTESKNGYFAEILRSENGINYVLKAPCPIKEIICGKAGCKRDKAKCGKCCKTCKKGCKGCKKGCEGSKKGKSKCPHSNKSKSSEAMPAPSNVAPLDDFSKGDEGDM